MKQQYVLKLSFLIAIASLSSMSCNKRPFRPDYDTVIGFVIGKEVCSIDTAKDFWLINIVSSSSLQQQYGDTVLLNGIQHRNVVKTSGLPGEMRVVGTKIGMDFYLSKHIPKEVPTEKQIRTTV